MGSCIAGVYCRDSGQAGRSAVVALRDAEGSLLANVEVRPPAHGWRIAELQGRFNREADPELAQRFRRWVGTLPVDLPASPVAQPPARSRAGRPARHSPPRRLLRDVRQPLAAGAARVPAAPAAV